MTICQMFKKKVQRRSKPLGPTYPIQGSEREENRKEWEGRREKGKKEDKENQVSSNFIHLFTYRIRISISAVYSYQDIPP